MPETGISAAQAAALARAAADAALAEAKQHATQQATAARAVAVGFGRKELAASEESLKKSITATQRYAEQKAAQTAEEIGQEMFKEKARPNPTKKKTIFTSKEARDLTKKNLKYFYSLYK
jgi:hypothetical protein